MKLLNYLYTLSVLLLLTLFSCVDDDLIQGDEAMSGSVTLQAKLSLPVATEVNTRADGEEESVTDVIVLVFTGDASEKNPKLVEIKSTTAVSTNLTFNVTLEQTRVPTTIYVLANAQRFFSGVWEFGDYREKEVRMDSVRQFLTDSIPPLDINANSYVKKKMSLPFAMSSVGLHLSKGIRSTTQINSTGTAEGTGLPLVRSVAKFLVKVDPGIATTFELLGVAPCYVSAKARIISNQQGTIEEPTPGKVDSLEVIDNRRIHYYDELAEGDKAFLFTPEGRTPNEIDNIYTYETKVEQNDAVKLVIYGNYTDAKGTRPCYYLLGVMDSGNNAYNITRNHYYKLTIKNVKAEGASSFDEALNGSISNINTVDFDIKDDNINSNISKHDNFIFSVDYDDVLLYADTIQNFSLGLLSTNFVNDTGNRMNRLTLSSNRVNGQPTLFFSSNNDVNSQLAITGTDSEVMRDYQIAVNVKSGFTEGVLSINLGTYRKNITLKKQRERDLHYDSLSVENVTNIFMRSTSGLGWVTFSTHNQYLEVLQKNFFNFHTPTKVFIYLDENMEKDARYAEIEYVVREGTVSRLKRLVIGQTGISRQIVGYYGGKMGTASNTMHYSKMLLIEAYEEKANIQWSNSTIISNPTLLMNYSNPKESTIYFAVDESTADAARYCLEKNRDYKKADGTVDESKVKWYLPSVHQMIGVSFAQTFLPSMRDSYWTSTLSMIDRAVYTFNSYTVVTGFPNTSGFSGPQIGSAYFNSTEAPRFRYVRCVRDF